MLKHIITARVKRSIKDALLFTYQKVKVKTNQGTVRGCVESLPNGQKYFRFSGIPYAKSPRGQLRFKSPQKLTKFESDEIDCTREGDPCFHRSAILKKFIGSENCLFLNVYAPADSQGKKLPVMVFIHGGGFMFDSGSADYYSPDYLLMEDVIVVTINYRLHALGFVSLPSMGISGNAGLKDQQMALEWVHENISNFNGDPANICLFGESCGASCVYLHTLVPKSRRFIKSAICQSSTAVDPWLFQKDGDKMTRRAAKVVGAKSDSDEDVYEALMKAEPEALVRSLFNIQNPDDKRRSLPFTMKPIVEQESDDAFIAQSPLELVKNQSGSIDLPLMIGKTSADGMTMTNYFMKNFESFDKDNVKMIPQTVNIDPSSSEAEELGREIRKFYFGDGQSVTQNVPQFINLMTDFYFTVPQTMHTLLNQIYHPKINQYLYEFDFDGKLNFLKKALDMSKYEGACHFDDLSYLFRHQIVDVPVSRDSKEYKMRERMCKLWTNFAKYGNPTPPTTENPLSISWDSVKPTDKDLKYMILDENPRVELNIHADRINFWKRVYEKHNGSFINPKF